MFPGKFAGSTCAGIEEELFSSVAAAQKGAKTVIARGVSHLDFEPFSVPLGKSDHVDHLDLTRAKESKRTESVLSAVSGKTLGNETSNFSPKEICSAVSRQHQH